MALLVTTSSDPVATAVGATSAATSVTAPTCAEVIGQYLCGNVLFGTDSGFRWQSYPTRLVIDEDTARVSAKTQRTIRHADFAVKFNEGFGDIMRACSARDQSWISPDLITIYEELHAFGHATSVGAYRDGVLVGGLWGLDVGRVFHGMSMFHRVDSAGTAALAACVAQVHPAGRWDLIDAGVAVPHLVRFGAVEVPFSRVQRQLVEQLGA